MTNFQWPVRVYYEDTDAGGVVYYANYLRFFERARTEWMRACGFEQDQLDQQHQLLFAVRSIQVDYLSPARFNQALIVDTQVNQFRGASILFLQTISLEADQSQVMCEAKVRIVCIHAQTFTARPIPEFLKQGLLKHV